MFKLKKNQKAQAAVELAVFGAIFIFMLGAIIRSSLGASYQQNQSLKALRVAMMTSHTYSEGGKASRNNASVLYIEDRLTASSAKYGSVDRTPYMISSRATHSKQLFMPVEHAEDLPVTDMYINGKHFPLSVSGYKTIVLDQAYADARDTVNWVDCVEYCPDAPTPAIEGCGACSSGGCLSRPNSPCPGSGAYCAMNPDHFSCGDFWVGPPCPAVDVDCDCALVPDNPKQMAQCVEFRKTVANLVNPSKKSKWCNSDDPLDVDAILCPTALTEDAVYPDINLSADERFDLDRDGVTDIDNTDGVFPDYKDFSWQWYKVMAYDDKQEFRSIRSEDTMTETVSWMTVLVPPRGDPQFEGIIVDTPKDSEAKNVYLDVDGDFKQERIIRINSKDFLRIITSITVLDSQEGDLDMTYDTRDYKNFYEGDPNPNYKPKPGLTNDVRMYTFVNEGTTLLIEEGKLFSISGDTRQYIRQTQKKDQIDLIERVIQLSNDTDRLCGSSGAPVHNSIEVCCKNGACQGNASLGIASGGGSCFSAAYVSLTCMDEGDLTAVIPTYPMIFVRSRIKSSHGRRWVTDVSSDSYINLDLGD